MYPVVALITIMIFTVFMIMYLVTVIVDGLLKEMTDPEKEVGLRGKKKNER